MKPDMNWYERFLCNFMNWHAPMKINGRENVRRIGINSEATCKRCYKDIMKDSQGNWF